MYALNLSADNRILSATLEQYAAPGQPLVEELPSGNIIDWRYMGGEYVYDPISEPVVYVTADRRYNIGDLIEDNGEMFEVISIILAGSKLILGSNIKQITLEEYINKKIEEGTV